jgi:Predicted metal-binding, possibly nucleic acid-binding protein
VKVDVTDLLSVEDKAFEQKVETELTSFQSKLGEFPIIRKAPFVLHLENHKKRYIKVTGTTDVVVVVPCDRCLKEVQVTLHLVIDRKLYLEEPEFGEDADEEDMGCIKDSALDVDWLIYDEILVNWPTKVLCREDCKGICRKCGTNLNDNSCSCDQGEPDPRMAAARDIFNQFKEV